MIMSTTDKILNFTAAVRGFHYYQKTWSPKEGEILNFYHERINALDILRLRPSPKMDLLFDIYLEKYLELPSLY